MTDLGPVNWELHEVRGSTSTAAHEVWKKTTEKVLPPLVELTQEASHKAHRTTVVQAVIRAWRNTVSSPKHTDNAHPIVGYPEYPDYYTTSLIF